MTLANKITLSRIALTPAFLALWYIPFPGHEWAAMLLFVAISLTDIVDGRIARRRGEITDFGKFIDPVADKMLTTIAFIVLVEGARMPAWVAMIFILRDIAVSGLRMVTAQSGAVIAAAWRGKAKTVSQIVCCSVLLVNEGFFADWGIPMGWISMAVALLFTLWSAADYIWTYRGAIGQGNRNTSREEGARD